MAATSTHLVPALVAGAVVFAGVMAVNGLAGSPLASTAPPPFTISGRLNVPLHPGAGAPLDLTLTNPNGQVMSVTGLAAAVIALQPLVHGPVQPCDITDFAVEQFSGEFPIDVPASVAKKLSQLGVPTSAMPVLRMLNTAVNQDGCKDATLTLAYTGVAEESH
jgi:hypothetical protein